MEIEYFIREEDWKKSFEKWKKETEKWTIGLGINKKNLRWRNHDEKELGHYSTKTEDMEYSFPFGGFKELYGLAYRTDYDLKKHSEESGKDLKYTDSKTGEKFFPHVIEPSFGLERMMLIVLLDAYKQEKDRIVLKLKPSLAPIKIAIFPLLSNKPKLVKKAKSVLTLLKKNFVVAWDERGNIGKRYYAQDEAGTPYCVTIDFDSLKDKAVTVRNRDTMKQKRVKIKELITYFEEKL